MVAKFTQESNGTGLSVAREQSLAVLPATPLWLQREPNSYKDFGATYKSKARNPINASRQQQKGVILDRDANGGWQEDLTYPALVTVAEAIMYAAYRTKGDVAVTGVSAANGYAMASGGDYFKAGDVISGSGFSNGANNGKRVLAANGAAAVVAAPGTVDEGAGYGRITKVGHKFAAGDLSLALNGDTYVLNSAAGALAALGVIPGESIYIGGDGTDGFATPVGGFCRVLHVSQDFHSAVLDKMQFPGVDAGAGRSIVVYVGRVVKNESNPDLIRRYTHHLERTLGKDDDTALHAQAEYIKGAVIDKWSIPFNTADKITMDFNFVGTDYEAVVSADGPKAGARPPLVAGDAFTTSNDIAFTSLNVVGQAKPLYAYLTDIALTVDNNVKGNKALGRLGSFDITAGNFVVTANANAYLANVQAQQAIIDNDSVTLSIALVRNGQGVLFDMPLVTLGDGKPKVAANEPITLALDINAARGSLISPDLDHTLMIVLFDYLPVVAQG